MLPLLELRDKSYFDANTLKYVYWLILEKRPDLLTALKQKAISSFASNEIQQSAIKDQDELISYAISELLSNVQVESRSFDL
jgi:hypothetical protein